MPVCRRSLVRIAFSPARTFVVLTLVAPTSHAVQTQLAEASFNLLISRTETCVFAPCERYWVTEAAGQPGVAIDAPIVLDYDAPSMPLGNGLSGLYSFELVSAELARPSDSILDVGIAARDRSLAVLSGNGITQFSATLGEDYFLYLRSGSLDPNGRYTVTISPVPEPTEWALMLAGLGLIGWRAGATRIKRG